MHFNGYALAALFAAGPALAHIEMSWPYPFRSRFNPGNGPTDPDMKSPISGAGFPCKGYHQDGGKSVVTYTPGSSYNLTLDGSAVHAGGSCQVSLSYDNGGSFQVIKSMMGDCPLKPTWDFTIPSDAAGGEALLAWTWFNLVGNREMYMNCAPVTIGGGGESGAGNGGAKALPALFTANIGGSCATVEGKETVFAEPGEVIEYGKNVNADSPVFPEC